VLRAKDIVTVQREKDAQGWLCLVKCRKCNRLICKARPQDGDVFFDVKCPRCQTRARFLLMHDGTMRHYTEMDQTE